jgi:hypothetical protein
MSARWKSRFLSWIGRIIGEEFVIFFSKAVILWIIPVAGSGGLLVLGKQSLASMTPLHIAGLLVIGACVSLLLFAAMMNAFDRYTSFRLAPVLTDSRNRPVSRKRDLPIVKPAILAALSVLLVLAGFHFYGAGNDADASPSGTDGLPSADTLPSQPLSRLRITRILAVADFARSNVTWPFVNVYYDNAGTGPLKSVAYAWTPKFVDRQLTEDELTFAQDSLFGIDGWDQRMASQENSEIYPGDAEHFLSIPSSEGQISQEFLGNFQDVVSGMRLLYIIIAFKYIDSVTGSVLVTEECMWFTDVLPSGAVALHQCGRNRTFADVSPALSP